MAVTQHDGDMIYGNFSGNIYGDSEHFVVLGVTDSTIVNDVVAIVSGLSSNGTNSYCWGFDLSTGTTTWITEVPSSNWSRFGAIQEDSLAYFYRGGDSSVRAMVYSKVDGSYTGGVFESEVVSIDNWAFNKGRCHLVRNDALGPDRSLPPNYYEEYLRTRDGETGYYTVEEWTASGLVTNLTMVSQYVDKDVYIYPNWWGDTYTVPARGCQLRRVDDNGYLGYVSDAFIALSVSGTRLYGVLKNSNEYDFTDGGWDTGFNNFSPTASNPYRYAQWGPPWALPGGNIVDGDEYGGQDNTSIQVGAGTQNLEAGMVYGYNNDGSNANKNKPGYIDGWSIENASSWSSPAVDNPEWTTTNYYESIVFKDPNGTLVCIKTPWPNASPVVPSSSTGATTPKAYEYWTVGVDGTETYIDGSIAGEIIAADSGAVYIHPELSGVLF